MRKSSLLILAASLFVAGASSLPGLLPGAQAADAPAMFLGTNIIADIAEKAAPGVVNIEVIKKNDMGEKFFFSMNGKKVAPPPQFKYLLPGPGARKDVDSGTGFIIKSDGYILTNRHVVKNATDIKVCLNDKRTFPGKVIGIDRYCDLAVVKIEAQNLPTLTLGNSSSVRPGEFVVAIGNALEYDHTVTMGIISGLGRTVKELAENDNMNINMNLIQTDAAINPGNSGGPLLNLKGEVIGVNVAKLSGSSVQSIGFAIPIDVAKPVATELISHGQVARPWLGIQMLDFTPENRKQMQLPDSTRGVLIRGFMPNSAGIKAGLQLGDIITRIDSREISEAKSVKEMVLAHKVGDTLHFTVMREHNPHDVPVRIGNYQDQYQDDEPPAAPDAEASGGGGGGNGGEK